jgi:TPP-dependent pyruvate/acetoin dehydrogenase alpha subunit
MNRDTSQMDFQAKDFSLGTLVDPAALHGPLALGAFPPAQLKAFLRDMVLIRTVENRLAVERRDGLIGGPVHLGVGQEAVAVGVSSRLRATDKVFGAHRSHSHLLALGSSVQKLFAEILGKDTGHSKGMGGSMHLWDQPSGFYGSVPIVAGTVPLAVGAGLAARMQKKGDVAVAYIGDGAVEEGVVHESLNLARMQNLPVIFVIENNLFASHMHISTRQPVNATARFAVANDIPSRVIDGNDVAQVSIAAGELIDVARGGGGPGFLEAVTFRWYGHVDWRDDIDVGVHRSLDEVSNWRARDPIARLVAAMKASGMLSDEDKRAMEKEVAADVDLAWSRAQQEPYPSAEALLGRVYADGKRKLAT